MNAELRGGDAGCGRQSAWDVRVALSLLQPYPTLLWGAAGLLGAPRRVRRRRSACATIFLRWLGGVGVIAASYILFSAGMFTVVSEDEEYYEDDDFELVDE